MLIVLAIFAAGLFLGTTAALAFCYRSLQTHNRRLDAERMLVVNKLFVREGQAPLFSEDAIRAATADTPEVREHKSEPGKVSTFVSPFQRGKKRARAAIEQERKEAAGANLPDSIKEAIAKAATQSTNGEAAV
jgi:hypothetical protein